MNSNEMIDIDLLVLHSIRLGYCALCGRNEGSNSLTMRSKNEKD